MIWPTYIDRHLPLTRGQRKAVHREAWRRWAANRWNLVLYLLLPAAYLIGLSVARDFAGMVTWSFGAGGLLLRMSRILGMVVWAGLCFAAGGAVFQRYRFAPLVYAALRQHGHDVCPKCGYWLKGLRDETHCPECGAERQAATPT